jgi:hypothetical protein
VKDQESLEQWRITHLAEASLIQVFDALGQVPGEIAPIGVAQPGKASSGGRIGGEE